ncbi:Sua5/YciO/YrdC/YwlC family tRNA threonylcarbamoyl adenosine modification protein [Pichia kudriavzevii]|nr:hypothetical protein JL09_g1659 [Pichia kudriavzevii]ONH76704.1 Threonylcarbamoyl-AMP synthase [Pichia kudriavzevii]OUT23182.1 Sua5/YciO/YrdC/YwlC family tRNA threonylcarbamoyl adenosine modification protein [Pichia kudriavzevii]
MNGTQQYETEVLKVNPSTIIINDEKKSIEFTNSETKKAIETAASLLRSSQVVGFPTETVYGLGASSLSSDAVTKIYEAKNRPADNPLISHISSVDMIKNVFKTEVPEIYNPLISKFWPGPLSIILPVSDDCPVSPVVTAGQNTFAVRMPENKIARALIQVSNLPLAAPSANASTRPSPTKAEHVLHDLNGRIPLILDGGLCDVGLESTVVDGTVDPPMLLRPGGVSLEEIRKLGHGWENIVLGKKTAGQYEKVRTPGMKYKHYSPTARVILFENFDKLESAIDTYLKNSTITSNTKIAVLTTKHWDTSGGGNLVIPLGKEGEEIQRNLFAALRDADAQEVDLIFVEGVDEGEQGLAIMNRLSKAASDIISNK